MAAILRDRINDLLTANADLEREVVRLRYAEAGNICSPFEQCVADLERLSKAVIHLVRTPLTTKYLPYICRVQSSVWRLPKY